MEGAVKVVVRHLPGVEGQIARLSMLPPPGSHIVFVSGRGRKDPNFPRRPGLGRNCHRPSYWPTMRLRPEEPEPRHLLKNHPEQPGRHWRD